MYNDFDSTLDSFQRGGDNGRKKAQNRMKKARKKAQKGCNTPGCQKPVMTGGKYKKRK